MNKPTLESVFKELDHGSEMACANCESYEHIAATLVDPECNSCNCDEPERCSAAEIRLEWRLSDWESDNEE